MKHCLSDGEVNRIASKLFELLENFQTKSSKLDEIQREESGYSLDSFLDRTKVAAIAGVARGTYECRRRRDKVFGQTELFGEPAWDMLLDLAVAEEEGARLSVSSACIGSCAPPSTALRYMKAMETSGLVARVGDITDARRAFVRLTRNGAKRVRATFDANSQSATSSGSFFNQTARLS